MQHKARKRFGQHFLTDQGLIDQLVREIAPRAGDVMIEIGPGLAALTQPLVERLGRLTVIELDRDLAARLRQRGDLCVIESDILRVDGLQALQTARSHQGHAADSLPATPQPLLRIVGNLPYNISSPILFHLLPWAPWVIDQHFMLQKEVIDRMVAKADTAAYGRLSVMLQWRYEMENILFVPPECFDPPPRVDSAVVRMRPRPEPAAVDFPLFEEMVQVAFSQRRKLLRHTLGRWLQEKGAEVDFDLQRRAEEVSPQEFVQLCLAVGPAQQTQAAASQ